MGAGSSADSCFCGLARDRPSSAPPIRVAVVGVGSQVGYSLLPMIAKGDMFGPTRRVIITGLDLKVPNLQENMKALEMELQDGNYPLLQKVTLTTNDAVAFEDADYALMLGAYPKQEGREDREIMEKNVTIFRTFGRMLKARASKDCKVVVIGPPANTNAFIISSYAPEIPRQNFFALTRLAQNRASGQVAARAGVPVGDVRNIIIWGRSDQSPKADVSHATISGVPVSKVLSSKSDQKWLEEDFPRALESRTQDILKARKAAAALSTSKAIVDFVRDMHCGSRSGEFTSAGVWSAGNAYGIPEDVYYSFPVVFQGKGRYKVYPKILANARSKVVMQQAQAALLEELQLAKEVITKLDTKPAPAKTATEKA